MGKTKKVVALKKPAMPKAPVQAGSVVALEEDEKTLVSAAEAKVRDVKLLVADMCMELALAEDRKNQSLKLLQDSQKELIDAVRKIAEDHGINPDGDPEDGRWTLNTSSMEFSRL